MRFEPLELAGTWLVTPEPMSDERGSFARTICAMEFASHGLNAAFVQSSISSNRVRGTVRGLHFQWPPSQEAKLVTCLRGSAMDVLLDLRPESATFLRHAQVRLDNVGKSAVYIPPGFAHGFQSLVDDVEIQYHMTDVHRPDLAHGFRWDDPAFGITFPLPVSMIAPRDGSFPLFETEHYAAQFRRQQALASS